MNSLNFSYIEPILFALYTVVFSLTIYLEKKSLKGAIASPLLILSLGVYMRAGIGLALLHLSPHNSDDQFIKAWTSNVSALQLLWLPLLVCLLCYSFFESRLLLMRLRIKLPNSFPSLLSKESPTRRSLIILYLIITSFFAFYLVASLFTHAFTRDFATYYNLTQLLWRLDTPTTALMRLRDIWFFLTPMFYFVLPNRIKLLPILLIIIFFASAVLSGSRGLLLYPSVLLGIGLIVITKSNRQLFAIFISLGLFAFISIPSIYVLRESPSFQSANNPIEKTRLLITLPHQEFSSIKSRLPYTGRDLYACHDPFLFKSSNHHHLNQGWKSFNAFPWVFIPKHLLPDQPPIFDGHIIAKRLQGISPSRWSSVWFPCISLPADLYRRFSITGWLTGSFFSALTIGIFSSLWKTIVTLPFVPVPFKLLLWSFPVSYIQSFPLGTLSESLWYFLWDLPKYLIAFVILSKASVLLSKKLPSKLL